MASPNVQPLGNADGLVHISDTEDVFLYSYNMLPRINKFTPNDETNNSEGSILYTGTINFFKYMILVGVVINKKQKNIRGEFALEMKNKDKKIISLMVVITLVITIVIGPINPISIVKAKDNKFIKIKDILNEDELVSDDEKLILSKVGEKISDNEFKVTLKIKGNNGENINLNNAIIEDSLNSGFEIIEDSVNIQGIEDKESINTDEAHEGISIELRNINTKEVKVSFLVKVRDDIEVKESIDVSQETKLTYNVLENKENEEKVEINFLKLNINLEEVSEEVNSEVIAEENTTNQAIDNIQNEIIGDIIQEEVDVEDNINGEVIVKENEANEANEDLDNIESEIVDDITQKGTNVEISDSYEYLEGSITIKKQIVKANSHGGWDIVLDDKINQKDSFLISIVGSEKYTVDLAGNREVTFNFYLQDNRVDIFADNVPNITMGKYSIEELIPIGYEQVGVYIENRDGSLTELKKGEKFTIDENNKDITIVVRNKLENKSYWYDKDDTSNEFKYYNPNTSNPS